MSSRIARVLGISLSLAILPSSARADRIVLRDGGRIKGKLTDDPARKDRVLVIQETGKTPLSFLRAQIIRVEPVKSVLDEYIPKRQALSSAAGAQAEYELGLWCESKKLSDLATFHFENAVKADPTHGPAHLKLGYVEHEGKWLNREELRKAQGLVLHKGKWITKDEKERLDAEAAVTAEHVNWVRRLTALKQAYAAGPEVRRDEVVAKLAEIREPDAIPGVLRVFASDQTPAFRGLAAKVLGQIRGHDASKSLVIRLLLEDDQETRALFGEQLKGRPSEEVVPHLAQGLRARSARAVNNAGWALGLLNSMSSVPKLVPALTSIESRVIWVETGGRATNPGPFGMNQTPAFPRAVGPSFGIGAGGSLPVLTGPVVGDGVVAFGATSVPYANIPVPVGPTVPIGPLAGMSARTAPGSLGPIPQTVHSTRRNPEVLAALVKLTGKDFGYDLNTWKRWLRTEFRTEAETDPVKTVPQP